MARKKKFPLIEDRELMWRTLNIDELDRMIHELIPNGEYKMDYKLGTDLDDRYIKYFTADSGKVTIDNIKVLQKYNPKIQYRISTSKGNFWFEDNKAKIDLELHFSAKTACYWEHVDTLFLLFDGEKWHDTAKEYDERLAREQELQAQEA